MSSGLIVDNIHKQLDRKNILNGVSFQVKPGKIFALLGGSGSGKTTLLKTINRLIDIDKGSIELDGQSIMELDPIELRHRAGMMMQVPTMFDGTVRKNIEYGLHLRGIKKNIKTKVDQAILDAGLNKKFLKKDSSKLSGGEQQRVALARLLVLEPEVLLLDEPTAAIDPKLSAKIENTIISLCKDRKLITIWVTHNHLQARRVGDHIGVLKKGKLKLLTKGTGSKNSLKKKPVNNFGGVSW